MFLFVSLSKSTFFTLVALVSFVWHLCSTRVTFVSLASLVPGACVVYWTRSLNILNSRGYEKMYNLDWSMQINFFE